MIETLSLDTLKQEHQGAGGKIHCTRCIAWFGTDLDQLAPSQTHAHLGDSRTTSERRSEAVLGGMLF